MSATKKRTKARTRQRGTATVETIAGMPVLIIAMAVSAWASELYEGKITAGKKVRGQTYTEALSGCARTGSLPFTMPKNALPSLGPQDLADDSPSIEGADVVVRRLPNIPGGGLVERTMPSRRGSIVLDFIASAFMGRRKVPLRGNVAMTCNESVEDGDATGVKRVSTVSFDPRSL